MSEEGTPAPPAGPRISAGNAELDRMLDGGLVPHRPYLLVGPSGTGKTTLALQFLCEGVRRGERVLFVTVEEPPNEILWNHRALLPDLAKVDVFDAIPDVMRFERTPFKDIAAVRSAQAFDRVDLAIRRTPELTSVEVTISALEQMLRTEVQRKAYNRVVVDSLTALQYFCMKGYEPALGAQSFLRFLSDLQVTTILTVESPLEDVDSPERMLARGEIRLFRWELDGVTVRAVGVEKFRGSSHDVRLHPYRIGARGIDINVGATMSRDTQLVVEARSVETATGEPALHEPSPVELLEQEVRDLLLVGADLASVRTEVEAALEAARQGEVTEAANHLTRALASGMVPPAGGLPAHRTMTAPAEAAWARIMSRAENVRAGVPPARMPEPPILAAQLARVLAHLRSKAASTPVPGPVGPEAGVPPTSAPPASVTPPPVAPRASPIRPPAASPPPLRPPEAPAPPRPTPPPTVTPVPAGPVRPAPTPPTAAPPPPNPALAPESPPAPSVTSPSPAASPSPPEPPRAAATVTPSPTAKPPVRVRAEPPPLPTPEMMPQTPVAVAPAPAPVPTPAVVPPVPREAEPVVIPSPTMPTAPVALSPTEASPTPPEAAAPKRKRRAAAPRKRAIEPATLSEPGIVGVAPVEVSSPVDVPAAEPAVVTDAPSVAKPKRRVVRKKKAPTVLGATAGPVPPGAEATAPPPPLAPDPAPPPSEGA